MAWWLGAFLLVSGLLSLVFNEFTVNVRRAVKPWWRDDENEQYDRWVKQFHRIVVYIGSVISVELGLWLIDHYPVELSIRVVLYLAFVILPVYRILREHRDPLVPTT